MQLEDYFDFLAPNDIRIKGHRIGIETVLYEYIFRSRTPEEIADIYRTLTLEEVYATILYYHHKKEKIHNYMTEWIEHGERMRAEQAANPTPVMERLGRILAEREKARRRAALLAKM